MNVIETSDLGKRYGRTWVLRECTLGIPAGHLAALVGPNGAGKTTLIPVPPGWEAHPVSLEELVLAYLRAPGAEVRPDLSLARQTEPTEVAR
jgi:ABC-2 type transport system ATP-binding protein